ncbi:MAG: Lrp/AsnC ligand binding domain-containing protein [Nitrososphaerales archaeon]
MSKALVLITVDSGTDTKVVEELKKVSSIEEIYEVYGAYDIIAMVEGDSNSKIKETVFNNIRRLEHVKSTLTMMIVED